MRKKPVYRKNRYWRKPSCHKGANNGGAKIHKSVVDYIRENYRPYYFTANQLAEKFGLKAPYVRQIIAGVTWKEKGVERKGQFRALTDEQAAEVRKLYSPNEIGIYKLSKMFHCNKGTISAIVKNRIYLRPTAGYSLP